ncbi:MAG TPA: response regulator, partial [Candidatus Limnocylindrales bacterium]|nr:response regulator [Candidatus Limnocylindrales bacterium]
MPATILIVEDEHAVARGIQYALEQEGYEVTVARSGEEGLEIATTQAPDLVLLDVRLPSMDGFEVLRRLRAAGGKAPVLMLTARDEEVDKVIGLELMGIDGDAGRLEAAAVDDGRQSTVAAQVSDLLAGHLAVGRGERWASAGHAEVGLRIVWSGHTLPRGPVGPDVGSADGGHDPHRRRRARGRPR